MRIKASLAMVLLLSAPADAQEKTISFHAGVIFETGDTWQYEGRKFRLFGVQSCLRGTAYRAPGGVEEDCGLRSIGSLAALFSTGTVACQPMGAANDNATFVVCAAELDGEMIDVGTALISSGAAFAAVRPSGTVVLSSYAIAESVAKEDKSGLWAGQFIHPNAVLAGNSEGSQVDLQSLYDPRDLPHGERLPPAGME
jgi:endonuclease YncB( thermonuclease family)